MKEGTVKTMVLKALACPSCNGIIETFDETINRGLCPYCRTIVYDVPDLQNAYEKILNRALGSVEAEKAEALLEKARILDLQGETSKATAVLLEMGERYPGDKRVWHALYKRTAFSTAFKEGYMRKFVVLADGKQDAEFLKIILSDIDAHIADLEIEKKIIWQAATKNEAEKEPGTYSDSFSRYLDDLEKAKVELQHAQKELSELGEKGGLFSNTWTSNLAVILLIFGIGLLIAMILLGAEAAAERLMYGELLSAWIMFVLLAIASCVPFLIRVGTHYMNSNRQQRKEEEIREIKKRISKLSTIIEAIGFISARDEFIGNLKEWKRKILFVLP